MQGAIQTIQDVSLLQYHTNTTSCREVVWFQTGPLAPTMPFVFPLGPRTSNVYQWSLYDMCLIELFWDDRPSMNPALDFKLYVFNF